MTRAVKIALLFGGQSAEYEVSLQSAANINNALEAAGFSVVPIGIERTGIWRLAKQIAPISPAWPRVVLLPGGNGAIANLDADGQVIATADVVFPAVHGPFGEDGSLQGLLKLANVAYAGPGVLASAVAMDKDVAKQLLHAAGIPVLASLSFGEDNVPDFAAAEAKLSTPMFVKPANMGSSVGVSMVRDAADYRTAVEKALCFDTKVLAETFADGQELECAVLSKDGALQASGVAEIVATNNEGFYSYDAKYIDESGARLQAPARLPEATVGKIQQMSIAAARALGCEGMVRVDFFLRSNGELFVNELNTIPGFTAISMYPKLWELAGIPPAELVTALVEHAQQRFAKELQLASERPR